MRIRRPAALSRLSKFFQREHHDEEQSPDSRREPPIQHKRRSSLAGGGDVVDYHEWIAAGKATYVAPPATKPKSCLRPVSSSVQSGLRTIISSHRDSEEALTPEEAANLEKQALVIKRGFKRWFEKAMSLNRVQLLMRIKLEIDLGWAFL
jgi:hypothetical protein